MSQPAWRARYHQGALPLLATRLDYLELAYLHLATVLPAFLIGSVLMGARKGTTAHRAWGRAYLLLMLVTALVSLAMPARVGPQFLGHFGFIHLLSLLALVSVPLAWRAARKRQVPRHRRFMIGLYCGGLLVAGAFALAPGRLLHQWIFGG